MEEKKQKEESLLKQLFVFAGSFKYLSILSVILAAVSAFIALVPFYYIWRIMKEVIRVKLDFAKAEGIAAYGWYAVGFALAGMLLYIAALMCSHIAAFRVQASMRKIMMEHIMKLPLGFIESEGSGKIRKIVVESSAATETYLAHNLPDKAVSVATPVGLIALLLVFDWRLGLICLIPAVLGFLFMGSMMGKEMENSMKEYQNSLETMSAEAVEYVRGIPVVKTFGQTIFSFKRFKDSIDKYEKWTLDYTKKMMKPMIAFTTAVNSTFAFIVAAAYLLGGHGISGSLGLNLFFYIIITPILTTTLMKLAYAGEAQLQVKDALMRMKGLMDRQPLPEPQQGKLPKNSALSLENVSFAYEGAEKNAVDGITLRINAGEHVAFVGPSGGGKTTLASLIARFWDVDKGSVKIGGVDVRDITSDELMNQISYVFQDSRLLKMSILDNIRIGRPGATDAEVMKALEAAQCMDIIEKLPDGVNTMIGTKGVYVSGGEAQRLSIARAFLKNAPVLILDEATAFADPDNEQRVQAAFEKLSREKTVIMIAHRLSTVTNADRIYVLKDGIVAESGSHQELTAHDGVYAHMWKEYNKSVNWKVGAAL
ncbi:MAG: ABC transporter ATP-binding protein/permease [Lachnospiraceae bacterium]|nr:ABC transporter ATP-binding protein/permease [Lachnospiraceae bacterium]